MVQLNEFNIQEGVNYEVLNQARQDKGWTMERTADESDVPEGTVKKILNGHTKNPGSENLYKLCTALGVPMEKVLRQEEKQEIEKKGIKDGNDAVLALKEIYELQISTMKDTNEKHIENIRAHYEQHHEDLVENFEKRLSDKREINDSLKDQINDLKRANTTKGIIIGVFVILFVVLFILELVHPEHGWLRF